MALVTVKPTRLDIAIASRIADHADPRMEHAAATLTWGADEHVLLALAAAGWLYGQLLRPSIRPVANHMLAVSVATSVLPHILKSIFNQTRPDRLMIRGHARGIPISGNPRDAFPSGHAVHMGALVSAAGLLPPCARRLVRGAAVGLSLTRIALLAHWTTDVLAGLALGAAVERLLRPRGLERAVRKRLETRRR